MPRLLAKLSPLSLALILAGCDSSTTTSQTQVTTAPAEPTPATESQGSEAIPASSRQVYFGDLHIHTSRSFDAFAFGVRVMPEDAYRFAKGETIQHPAGFPMKLSRPLDFMAVTDHAEYLGVVPALFDPTSSIGDLPIAKELQAADSFDERLTTFYKLIGQIRSGDTSLMNNDYTSTTWQMEIDAAEAAYEPGKFTSFSAYEFTSSGSEQQNLHRNVIFRGTAVPDLPYSSVTSTNPEDLWAWMDEQRAAGREVLAIPHNSNGSDGMMFEQTKFDGSPMDAAYAELRMRNEPIVEVSQVKGTSETHPLLSPNDEWADFEIFAQRIASDLPSKAKGSYVREAYRDGLVMEQESGFNPYKFGLIGSSDAHVGGGAFDEDNYWGKVGMVDGSPELRGSVPVKMNDGEPEYFDTYFEKWSASGLAAVWAEENTREAIFDALRRKETYATSGTRIRLRAFAGYALGEGDLNDSELVAEAYDKGVAMGSELPSSAGAAPELLALASRDPMAAPLDRLQVIKGWVDADGASHEAVYDVACANGQPDPKSQRCPATTATVDADCSLVGEGASELSARWQDPTFDATQKAFYYVRVLENPSCRWSTWDALRAGVEPRQSLPESIQERAWSSPIWYPGQN